MGGELLNNKKRSPIWKPTAEEFKAIVDKSKTTTEVLAHFGMQNKGGNYKTFNQRVKDEGIDISHFIRVTPNPKKLDLHLVFKKDSTVSRSTIRRRIIREQLIPYECKGCKNNGTWNGKELSLHLEHMNGIGNDHRLENLCFLCPNCHSQTDTYSGKNNIRVPKPTCLKCSKGISRTTKNQLCQGCFAKERNSAKGLRRRKVVRPDKETLLKEIQDMGYVKTGKKYAVSDNAIRKWLKSYEKLENQIKIN